ncbi:helix-turn-helix domain-containing protein [Enterobacter asburiae]|uniref:helix-turn-helix domain-containing protein n=1 Tax=Enterobacter asburiae TaxID=61645 RepID=UPI0029D53CF4|nr:helix-turn-helix domain-containing protein [Enterobacter asburiae]MDX7664738.1 helix-turn-helix domain-containing protein [Enterobacter asburiae]
MKKSIAHDAATFAVGESLRTFMLRAGIQEHKQADFIKKALGVSATHAYRKMRDISPWEVSQLQTLLSKLGYSLSEFFEHYDKKFEKKADATIEVNKEKTDCVIYFTDTESDINHEFSALQINGEWCVYRTAEMHNNPLYMETKKNLVMIQIFSNPTKLSKYKIAILDDDENITKTLKDTISDELYKIETFSSIEDLCESIKKAPYDAYVLDWIVHNDSVFETIKKIRTTSKPDALIIALTGQLGGAIDEEIAQAINDHDVLGPYEKPLRLNVFKTLINKYFSR